ncbi:MAG: glycoside-pentoside-hexuronide (GPH):cation symporter [Propionibacteriaceae bacterium]|jgi:sugar (glycoside-pentoside-hexuronide) transporter|nr:glycoside-pentoside-hexuronide (GPH):cation symporter [Propionibacteriaceae bacterium]
MARPPGYLVSGRESLSYSFYFLGQNISSAILSLYLIVFFTDIGIPAATVGVITLLVKGWDAVNDPIFGGLVDKFHLKGGKFMPWIRVAVIALPLATAALFAIPSSLSTPTKVVLGCIGYILWDTAYTIGDLPIFGLVTTLTNNEAERTRLMSWGRLLGLTGFIVASLVIPLVRQAIPGWFAATAVLCVFTAVFMAPIAAVGRERITPPPTADDFGLKDMLRYLRQNKYLLFFNLAIIVGACVNTASSLGILLARHLLGDETQLTLISACSILPALIFGAFLPTLAKRFDKFHLFFAATLVSAAFGVLQYFIGYDDAVVFYIVFFIRYIPFGVTLFMMFMFTPDCVEYGLYKTGVNASGVAFAVQTFTAKFTAAIGTAVGAFALAAIGYVEKEGAVQAPGFEGKLWAIFTVVPALCSLLAVPLLLQYKLRDKDVQVMARANTGEITRGEADALLGGRYR